MTTYKGINGFAVQSLATDPSPSNEGQVWYNNVSYAFKLAALTTSAAWSSGTSLPAGRSGMGGAGTSTATLINGGELPAVSNATLLYNGTSWTTSPGNMNTARAYLSTTGTQTSAITANGNTNPAGNNYGTNSETWNGTSWTATSALSFPSGVRAGSGTSTAALMSGAYSNNPSQYNQTSVESWGGSSWTNAPSLNTGRSTAQGGAGTQTAAAVIGGFTFPPSTAVTNVENYNGSSWTNATALNTGRKYHAVSGSQTSVLAYFGATQPIPSYSATSEVWNGSSWTSSATGTTGREALAGLGNSGTISSALAIGGTPSGPAISSAVELYTGAGAPVTKTITTS